MKSLGCSSGQSPIQLERNQACTICGTPYLSLQIAVNLQRFNTVSCIQAGICIATKMRKGCITRRRLPHMAPAIWHTAYAIALRHEMYPETRAAKVTYNIKSWGQGQGRDLCIVVKKSLKHRKLFEGFCSQTSLGIRNFCVFSDVEGDSTMNDVTKGIIGLMKGWHRLNLSKNVTDAGQSKEASRLPLPLDSDALPRHLPCRKWPQPMRFHCLKSCSKYSLLYL